MPRPSTSFTALAGVSVQYDRMTPGAYGTRGVPYRFYCEAGFIASLEACFEELGQACPLGPPEMITSAGAWVEKPGRHGSGQAFDLDGLFWSGREFVTLYDGFQGRDRRFYYAVECILRRHFGQVLNFSYNADHRDHFHLDHAAAVGLRRGSNAVAFFVQGLLRTVFELSVAVDGRWGNQTEGALQRAASRVGVNDLDRTLRRRAIPLPQVRRMGQAGTRDQAVPKSQQLPRYPQAPWSRRPDLHSAQFH